MLFYLSNTMEHFIQFIICIQLLKIQFMQITDLILKHYNILFTKLSQMDLLVLQRL